MRIEGQDEKNKRDYFHIIGEGKAYNAKNHYCYVNNVKFLLKVVKLEMLRSMHSVC